VSTLNVPGSRLHYEVLGSGPMLVLIPGATGDAEVFRPLAAALVKDFTVAIYDRRGFSRSRLTAAQDYTRRLATDADDAGRLIEQLDSGPAYVFGASSGAIVALELLTRLPDRVAALVPFEAPVMRQLAAGERWLGFFAHLYELYLSAGPGPALKEFRERTFAAEDQQVMISARGPSEHGAANTSYWFEHELRQYPAAELDLKTLAVYAPRIVPASGRLSCGHPAYQATAELSRTLNRPMIELPGGHTGPASHATDFARGLVVALEPYIRGRNGLSSATAVRSAGATRPHPGDVDD